MTILVTGASGFLGSHVAEQLSQAGQPVRALVRRSSNTKFLSTLRGVELAYGSVEDRASCLAATEGVSGIIHVVGLVKAKSSEDFLRVNTEGTENLLEGAEKNRDTVRRFVFVSSQAAGGPSDGAGTPVQIGQETAPVTAYGRSKLAAEKSLLAAKNDVHSVIIRPPAIYGPRDSEILIFFKAVASGILPLTNPIDAQYSMIYGPDCANACIKALSADVPSGSTFYVEDGEPIAFGEMIRRVEIALGKKAWMRIPLPKAVVRGAAAVTELYGKATNQAVMLTLDKCKELHATGWVCDGGPARAALGWKPTLTFGDGVKLTADWYKREGWL